MKPWYFSKTLWVNILATLLISITANIAVIQPYLPEKFYVVMCLILPVVNMVLRFYTTQALTTEPVKNATP